MSDNHSSSLSARERLAFLHAKYMSTLFDMAKVDFRPIYQDVEEDFALMYRTGFFCAVDATTDKLVLNTVSREFIDQFICYNFSVLYNYLFDNTVFRLRDCYHPFQIEDLPLLSIREFNEILPEKDFDTYFSLSSFDAGMIRFYNVQGHLPIRIEDDFLSVSRIREMNEEYRRYQHDIIEEQARQKKLVRFQGFPDSIKKDFNSPSGKMIEKHI